MENSDRYKDLQEGKTYTIHDHNTCFTIGEAISTFRDKNITVLTPDDRRVMLSRTLRIVDGAEYVLLKKEPGLVFKGPVRNRLEKCTVEGIKACIADYRELEDYMKTNGLSISPADLFRLRSEYEWNMDNLTPFKIRDRFDADIRYMEFNGNPLASAHHDELMQFIIAFLTGRPELALYVNEEMYDQKLDIHLQKDGFTVMSGPMTLVERYDNRIAK